MPSSDPASAPFQSSTPDPLTGTGQFLARCSVCAGGTDTEYLRLGRGTPVLLLAADSGADEGPALLAPLSARFRVIAPCGVDARLAASEKGFVEWLRDFLDGLGVAAAGVVAESRLGSAALCFAAAEPSRVLALALVGAASPGPAGPTPLLVLSETATDLGLVVSFLASHA